MMYDITDLKNLEDIVQTLSREVSPGMVLALEGVLGSGKTTFTQLLLNNLGVSSPVTSPTFTIMNQYETAQKHPVYHLDLYRLKHPNELANIGLEELITPSNLVIIEWPELASDYLPAMTWWFEFSLADDGSRKLKIER